MSIYQRADRLPGENRCKFSLLVSLLQQKGETFADGDGQLLNTNRDWEDGYRQRWQHDKMLALPTGSRTGSCSWKFTSKTVWSPGKTEEPTIRYRSGPPNHELAARGASYSCNLDTAPTA
ncbi:hypothetical protein ACNKHX_07570 [Shigella flexneri]